jgi:hypothetical protein
VLPYLARNEESREMVPQCVGSVSGLNF